MYDRNSTMSAQVLKNHYAYAPGNTGSNPSDTLFVQIQLEPEGLQNTEGHEIYDLLVGPGILLPPDDLQETVSQPDLVTSKEIIDNTGGIHQTEAPSTQVTNKELEQYLIVANEYIKEDIAKTTSLSGLALPDMGLPDTTLPNTFLDDLHLTPPCDFFQVNYTSSAQTSYTYSSNPWDTYGDITMDIDSVYNAYMQQPQVLSTTYGVNGGINQETNVQKNNTTNQDSESINVKAKKTNEVKQFYKIGNKDIKINKYLVIYTPPSKNKQLKQTKVTNTAKNNNPKKQPFLISKKAKVEEKHICDICNKELCRRSSLREHMLSHDSYRPYVCDICEKGFIRKDHYTRHSKIHIRNKYVCACSGCKIKPFNADECSSVQQNLKKIHDQHPMSTSEPEELQTSVDAAQQSSAAQNNNTGVTSGDKHTCEYCNKQLSSQRGLHEHLRLHTGKPFVCDICDKSYITKGHYTRHKEIHGPSRTKTNKINTNKFKCEICYKQFRRKHSYSEHQFIHTGEKPFVCEICNTSYSRRGSLNRHRKTHRYNKFKCDLCPKDYSTIALLKKHSVTHTETNYFICDTCNKRFVDKRYLIGHIRNHCVENSKKEFLCNYCSSCYKTNNALKLHLKGHTDTIQESFNCNICNKRYKQKQHLKLHLLFEHSEEKQIERPFECEICNKVFKDKNFLENHLLIHSKEKQLEKSYSVPSHLTLQTYVQQWTPFG